MSWVTTIYHYRIHLDPNLSKRNNDCFEIVFDKETKYIQSLVFEFSSRTQLTLKEVEDRIVGTIGIEKIEGSFKPQALDSKFYTPSIEEFHMGFEYEYKGPFDGIWYKESFVVNGYNVNLEKFIKDYSIRVKYFDRSDLEDLGWYIHFNGGFGLDLKNRTIRLWFDREKNVVEVYVNPTSGDEYKYKELMPICLMPLKFAEDTKITETVEFMPLIFKGTVKNKSEFKRLMQQLNITE